MSRRRRKHRRKRSSSSSSRRVQGGRRVRPLRCAANIERVGAAAAAMRGLRWHGRRPRAQTCGRARASVCDGGCLARGVVGAGIEAALAWNVARGATQLLCVCACAGDK